MYGRGSFGLTMADLNKGERAVIVRLGVQGGMRARLRDIGLITGTRVECVLKGPFGDPAAYLIRGALIALRREEAAEVYCKDIGKAGERYG
jgi:ferrous iron transport protein A